MRTFSVSSSFDLSSRMSFFSFVMEWLELLGFFEKAHNLVQVEEGLLYHLHDLIFVAAEPGNRLKKLLRDDVLIWVLYIGIFPKLELPVHNVVDHLRVLVLPPIKAAFLPRCIAMHLQERKQLSHQPITRQLERSDGTLKALEEHRANNIRPTTCFCRFSSKGSMLL